MTEKKEIKTTGDVNAEFDETCSWVSNPIGIIKQNPFIFSEQPENPFTAKIGNGAFSNLKGIHNIMGHLQVAEKMIAGKGNNLIETFGEDVQENTYTMKIAGIAARLDAQIDDEAERTGKRPERLGWAYARKDGKDDYVTLYEIGETDERVRNSGAEVLPVEEKADTVMSVQCFNGEMDVAGGRTHFRHVHWINGESVEARAEKQVILNRPILPLAAPKHAREVPFPIAEIKGYDEDFVPEGKLLRMPIFALCDEDKAKIVLKGNRKNNNKDIKVANEFEAIRAVLTSEPMFAAEIAEKTGMKPAKISKILKAAISAGVDIKRVNKKNSHFEMRPAFSL